MTGTTENEEDGAAGEIGGYFELALPDFGDPYPAPFIKYQSARAALRAAIEASALTRVLLPAYVCDSVVQAVADAGRAIDFYHLNAELLPDLRVDLPADTWLLYVNYFGICDKPVARLMALFPAEQLLIDNTQALFSGTDERCVTIHSPRKFVGLPDGGLLRAGHLHVEAPAHEDENSIERMDHLLIRAAQGARAGYKHFVQASRTLEDTRPLRMSRLTQRLLSSIDFASVRSRRRDNFRQLSRALQAWNEREWPLDAHSVPLCYPLVLKHDVAPIRRRLAVQGIYVPTYWEDARHRIDTAGIESALLDRCLALPCDQRHTEEHIDRLIGLVTSELQRL